MSIKSITLGTTGSSGVVPREVFINSTATYSQVTTAGYLDTAKAMGFQFNETDFIFMAYNGGTAIFTPSITNGVITLLPSSGEVILPVTTNHIAVFSGTTGAIGDDAATAINGGNIQAGLSGTSGSLASFPASASKGSLKLVAVANTGNTLVTISNALHGQASVYSIPDCGASTANFITSASAGTQTIATGNLALSLGTLALGSSAHASSLTIFPATAANGTLIISAGNAGGAFNTTLTSGTIGQSTTYTIPDIGASTGGVVVSTAAVRMKAVDAAAAAGGNAAQSFTDAFCTSTSVVIGNWVTQANAASVLKIVPGNGSFVVTSSADAGVGTFSYIIMK